MKYIISIDQSTQGTKALLFEENGKLVKRCDLSHEQIVNEKGWVSHNLNEIFSNTIQVLRNLIAESGIDKKDVMALGISNQRETTACWDKISGEPLYDAIVWQCGRAEYIGKELVAKGYGNTFRDKTGIPLSGYFPACKMGWFLQNVPEAARKAEKDELCMGTIDSWLVFKLTKGKAFKTDYSNASRTQLMDIRKLDWDEELTTALGIPMSALAQICDSNSVFGFTDLEGFLEKEIPICGVLGDSHAALFGQGCINPGMVKATYGTGSSLMMNIGKVPVVSNHGVVTSIAWGMDGEINYCLEGNLNYTGATISWLKDDVKLIDSAGETESFSYEANPEDRTYIVPAFTGLGAPYWDADATAAMIGITRTTGKAEVIKAAVESIAYQISDLIFAMDQDTDGAITELRVDGGPTRNTYLMQFQSDISGKTVCVPDVEELSGIGAAYAAGISVGVFDREKLFASLQYKIYEPQMEEDMRNSKYKGWKTAVSKVLTK